MYSMGYLHIIWSNDCTNIAHTPHGFQFSMNFQFIIVQSRSFLHAIYRTHQKWKYAIIIIQFHHIYGSATTKINGRRGRAMGTRICNFIKYWNNTSESLSWLSFIQNECSARWMARWCFTFFPVYFALDPRGIAAETGDRPCDMERRQKGFLLYNNFSITSWRAMREYAALPDGVGDWRKLWLECEVRSDLMEFNLDAYI